MEAWIGEHWHRFATRRAQGAGSVHRVELEPLQRGVSWLLNAAGAHQRVATATPVAVGGMRSVWQRVAGSGRRAALAQLDAEVLALPACVDVYDDAALNRDLYRWWAALAAHLPLELPWAEANRMATERALQTFAGLRPVWQRLRRAELTRRVASRGEADTAERAVRALLAEPSAAAASGAGGLAAGVTCAALRPLDVAPVWCWVVPVPSAGASGDGETPPTAPDGERPSATGAATRLAQRRRMQRREAQAPRAPLLLASKGEWLKTFADPMNLDRGEDDDDEDSAAVAADELETLGLQRADKPLAARVRFDLDLPSASADDRPVGDGEALPEWDYRQRRLIPGRVLAQTFEPRAADAWQPAPALRALAARVRRRMDLQRAAPRWQRGARDGEGIDLDAWVRARADAPLAGPGTAPACGMGGVASAAEAVYQRRVKGQRELATLLLADLSLSTDAYANDHQRVIEVIRDALFVFGEALAAHGDAFAMMGFSSIKRQLRLHDIKRFDERWGAMAPQRLGSLRPGYYTRMGAALRAGTRRLQQRPERQRLLLLLTDGKPHDLDGYEGRLGLEDTQQAVLEARRAGLLPFAVSIDSDAGEVLPALFGHKGFAWVRRPEELPHRLAALHAQLMR